MTGGGMDMTTGLRCALRLSGLVVLLILGSACNFGTNPESYVAARPTTLRFSPQEVRNPGAGERFAVDVAVDNVQNLIAARFTVTFDPAVLQAETVTTAAWDYLFEETGASVHLLEQEIDNTGGRITVGMGGIASGFTGATGSGALATITFRSVALAATTLRFASSATDDVMLTAWSATGETGWTRIAVGLREGNITVRNVVASTSAE